MKTALVVDDMTQVREMLAYTIELKLPGWRAIQACGMEAAEAIYRSTAVHLAILDVGLPESSSGGFELFQRWRADGATFPIILISAAHADKLWDARNAGVDDVLEKPFKPMALTACINAVLRRHAQAQSLPVEAPRVDGIRITDEFTVAGVRVTPNLEVLFPSQQPVRIGPKEYGILRCFAGKRGGLVTKEEIIRDVWGPGARTDTNSIYNYITRLRKLFAENGADFDAAVQAESKAGWRILG